MEFEREKIARYRLGYGGISEERRGLYAGMTNQNVSERERYLGNG